MFTNSVSTKHWCMVLNKIAVPPQGEKVTIEAQKLKIPDNPIIPFIEGDGTGPELWHTTRQVIDAAVEKAYGGSKKISWMEVYAGKKAQSVYGKEHSIPEETIAILRDYKIAIKGPITTPVGGQARSINVTLRQELDLYAYLRPIRYFKGIPSPLRRPELVNITIFRENIEDVYAGIEFEIGDEGNQKILDILKSTSSYKKIRFPESTAIGLKPVSKEGTERLIRAAIQYAVKNERNSVTFVHKGNIMKCTEGNFCKWGYELAKNEFRDETILYDECGGNAPPDKILIKDNLADTFLQQTLTRPVNFDVIATLNLNGDYISDALAAQVGGIAPGASLNYETGIAIFEATNDTAPKYAGLDKVNPCSLILSGQMMLRYMNWNEAAENINRGLEKIISQKMVTYDFARLMDGATEVKCSEFGKSLISNM